MRIRSICSLVGTAVLHGLGQSQDHRSLLRTEASWDVAVYESATICGWIGAVNMFIATDTVINGEQYSRFGYHPILDNDGPPFCPPGYYVAPGTTTTEVCLREDTVVGLVFQYDHALQTEHILYDYSIEVGDTIHDYFDWDLVGWDPTPTVVVSMDSVQLSDGVYYRRWQLSTDVFDGVLHDYIEGVGSTFGITHEAPQYYGDGAHLWCYKRNEVDVLWSVHYCPLPAGLSVQDPGKGTMIQFFNASGGSVSYDIGRSSGDLIIRAIDGRSILRASVSGSGSIPWTGHPTGIYVYEFQDRTGLRWTRRFIAE